MTNKERYKKAFDVLASSEQIYLEVNQMKKTRNKKYSMKRVAVVAVICIALLGAGTAVYAAVKYYGILDFTNSRTYKEVPEEAVSQIQTNIETTQGDNDTIFNCTVREALCDSQSITLIYEVSAIDRDKYLFVPEDALPEDLMSNWSSIADKTAQEYASENNLTIVNIGGGIMNREDLGIASISMDFFSGANDVMNIYVYAYYDIAESHKTMNIDVVATGRISNSEDVMKLESSFVLQDMSTTTTSIYLSGEETPQEGFFKIEKAEVIQTDLGTYVDVFYTNENGKNPEDGLTFRIVDQLGNDYVSFGGGSSVDWIEGNHYKERCILNKSDIGDILSIEAFDCFEKNVYGVTKLYIEAID